MLKILRAKLQQYVNHELSDVQVGFRKGTGTRGQIPNIRWIITNWKTLKEMGIPGHLTCLLRNLYAGQEATVRTMYQTTDCPIQWT